MKLLHQTDFYQTIAKERERSDRTGTPFSLVVFENVQAGALDYFYTCLDEVLKGRLRSYDCAGKVNSRRFGVLLPETSEKGASRVAEYVQECLLRRSVAAQHTVMTYPYHWIAEECREETKRVSLSELQSDVRKWAAANEQLIKNLGPELAPKLPFWKRLIDTCGALFALALLSPVLLLIALYIKIVSPGPVIFSQERVGFMGKTFTCFKFRTMKCHADTSVHTTHFSNLMKNDAPMQKLDDADRRIIPFGTLLRKTGLDELPQLLNVLRGDMSLIGPRPCIPYEANEYKVWQRKRFDTVPGLTGLWQVSGKNTTTFNQMMRYDIAYAQKKSLSLDTSIFFKTIPAIVKQLTDK